jgi:hypothetical protein
VKKVAETQYILKDLSGIHINVMGRLEAHFFAKAY